MSSLIENLRSLARYEHADLSVADEAADDIERLRAENARLIAGGCARDQTTTQFCAEAVALQAENARLREALEAFAHPYANDIASEHCAIKGMQERAHKALKGE